jgi:hypothetical protein
MGQITFLVSTHPRNNVKITEKEIIIEAVEDFYLY